MKNSYDLQIVVVNNYIDLGYSALTPNVHVRQTSAQHLRPQFLPKHVQIWIAICIMQLVIAIMCTDEACNYIQAMLVSIMVIAITCIGK